MVGLPVSCSKDYFMEKSELYSQVALLQLEEQERRRRTFDLRMSRLFTIAVALVGIATIAIKDFSGSSLQGSDLSGVAIFSLVCLIVIALLFLAIMGFSLAVFSPSNWRRDPDLVQLSESLPCFADADEFAEWLGNQYRNSVSFNEKVLSSKATRLSCSVWTVASLAIFVLFLAASVRFV